VTDAKGILRLRRALVIHRVVQVLLLVLLLYMGLLFQDKFQEKYASLKPFYSSLVLTLLIQAAIFLPIRKFAESDARRELAGAATSALSVEELKKLRSQRMFSDFLKASVFIFFVTFILLLNEQATVFHATAFFSCIATVLTYLQSFNHVVRRELGN